MNSINQPLVSIGVPYFNSQNYIIHTLESIKNQTYANIELLLINDCCTDDSQAMVDDWIGINHDRFANVIQIINVGNKGLAWSCKAMQEASNGIFFSKLDSDDIILPEKIEKQVEFMLDDPEVAMVYSNTLLIDSNGNLIEEDYFTKQHFTNVLYGIAPSGNIFHRLLMEDFIPNPAVLIRKSMLAAVGGYDENLFAEDWDMWLRIAKEYPVKYMKGFYSQYRIHPGSLMRNNTSLIKVYSSLIKAHLKHKGISKEFDKIIAKHLFTYTIGLYRFGVIDKNSLKTNLHFNKNWKSLMYYLLGVLKIKINQKAC